MNPVPVVPFVGVNYSGTSRYDIIIYPIGPQQVPLLSNRTCHLKNMFSGEGVGTDQAMVCIDRVEIVRMWHIGGVAHRRWQDGGVAQQRQVGSVAQ